MEILSALVCDGLRLGLDDFYFLSQYWDGRAASLLSLLKDRMKKRTMAEGVLQRAEEILKDCQHQGLLCLHPRAALYPESYLHIQKPPLFLTYRGNPELLQWASLSVVGSREPLIWVERWMESEFIPYVRKEKTLVVSGGAIGLDQMAHRCALRAGGKTLAILPSGLGALYPRNMKSFLPFVDRGDMGLLSEYPPQMLMKTFHFHRRNRLISAHSENLFIVQAHKKSGTMITAQYGVEQGKNLVVLASDPMEPKTLGNLQLLYDGAQMIRWGSDLPARGGRRG